MPSNILHSEKSARDLIGAFDAVFKILLRELESLKSDLRREKFWKGQERRQRLHQLKATGFAPEPQGEGVGPQESADVVRELLQDHYQELLRHARRHIRHDELAGDIPRNSLDPRDIVDEVVRRAMAKSAERPKRMNAVVWSTTAAGRLNARGIAMQPSGTLRGTGRDITRGPLKAPGSDLLR